MGIFSGFVVFLIIWWTALFLVLPLGVRGQAEEGNIVPGSEPGAPVHTNIKKKFLQTTAVSIVLWLIVCALIVSGVIDWSMLSRWTGQS